MRYYVCKANRCVLFLIAVFASGIANAMLEEVVVTAQKRVENSQDIPLSIEVVSGEFLERNGVFGLFDLSTSVPGVGGFEAPGSRGNVSINLRGISSGNSNSLSVDPANALYIDGVLLGKGLGNGISAIDLERIEVLKGPQGTLYGRNSTGGAVNFITRKPGQTAEAWFKAGVGNYNAHAVSGRVNVPLSDQLALSLSAYSRQRDPLYENTNDSFSGFENVNRDGGRFALRWHINENTIADYSVSYDSLDEYSHMLDVVGFNPLSGGVFSSQGYPDQLSSHSADRIHVLRQYQQRLPQLEQTPQIAQFSQWLDTYIGWAQQQLGALDKRPTRGSSDSPSYTDTSVRGHNLTLTHAVADVPFMGNVEFKSISGWRESKNNSRTDLDGMNNATANGVIHDLPLLVLARLYFDEVTPLLPAQYEASAADNVVKTIQANGRAPLFEQSLKLDHQQFSQELQMVVDNERLQYVLGAYYYEEDARYRNSRMPAFPLSYSASTSHDVTTEATSIYGQMTWTPGMDSPWAFTVGGRYTRELKTIRYLWRSLESPLAFFAKDPAGNYLSGDSSVAMPEQVGVYGKTFSKKFNNFSGKLSAQYYFNDDVNVFLSYANGYRSGGFNGDFYDPSNESASSFDEEVIDSIELGVKSSWLNKDLQVNATVYAYDYQDLQISTLLPQSNSSVTSSISNAGAAKRTGLELSVKYLSWDSVLFDFSYNYINGHFDEFPAVKALAQEGGATLDIAHVAKRSVTPDHQLLFGVTWAAYKSAHGALELSLNSAWQSEAVAISAATAVYDTDDNRLADTPVAFAQPSVGERLLVGARAAWRANIANGSLVLALWGRNLLDEEYRNFSFNYGSSLGLVIAQYGEPRTFGLDLSWEM